jgi:transposase
VAQIRSGGALAPMKQGGDRRPQRIEAEAAFILGAVARQPDLTLAELKAKLRERDMSVGIGTLWLFFQRHRITLKKKDCACRRAAAPGRE